MKVNQLTTSITLGTAPGSNDILDPSQTTSWESKCREQIVQFDFHWQWSATDILCRQIKAFSLSFGKLEK